MLKTLSTILIFLAVFFIAYIGVIFFIEPLFWPRMEQNCKNKFYAEAKNLNLIADRFFIWEGDCMGTIYFDPLKEKSVSIKFYPNNIKIRSIGNIDTTYTCFTKKGNYSYPLDISGTGMFSKWFPFRAKTIKDIKDNYDLIVSILQKNKIDVCN